MASPSRSRSPSIALCPSPISPRLLWVAKGIGMDPGDCRAHSARAVLVEQGLSLSPRGLASMNSFYTKNEKDVMQELKEGGLKGATATRVFDFVVQAGDDAAGGDRPRSKSAGARGSSVGAGSSGGASAQRVVQPAGLKQNGMHTLVQKSIPHNYIRGDWLLELMQKRWGWDWAYIQSEQSKESSKDPYCKLKQGGIVLGRKGFTEYGQQHMKKLAWCLKADSNWAQIVLQFPNLKGLQPDAPPAAMGRKRKATVNQGEAEAANDLAWRQLMDWVHSVIDRAWETRSLVKGNVTWVKQIL